MTQDNDAADRAQEFNDVSVETTASSNESFAQDWLDAEEKERAEQTNDASRPRVVATLPDWATFGKTSDEGAGRGDWRDILRSGKLRTTGVAFAAFGLGVLCASGSWRGEQSEEGEETAAVVSLETADQNGAPAEYGLGELTDDALASIDSSTLRSVPHPTSVDFIPQERGAVAASEDAVVSNGWGNDGVSANVNGRASGELSANGDAGNFGDLAAAQAPLSNAGREDDSNWRRGVDFQRDVEAPSDATANIDRFPTWDELGANVPTVADVLNAPIETSAPVAANVSTPENASVATNARPNVGVANNIYPNENAEIAQNSTAWPQRSVGNGVDYTAYNGNAGYQGGDAANLNGVAPQFAGNSQNSGYNQTDGSENFAGWPTTAATPASNFVSTAPSGASNFASVAPTATPASNFASTVPSGASNFSSVAPTAPSGASNFSSVAPTATPASNFAPTAPSGASNFASVAPTATPASNFASTAPSGASNFASVAPTAASAEAPRAMVAQVPNEKAPVAAPNVATPTPNLRW